MDPGKRINKKKHFADELPCREKSIKLREEQYGEKCTVPEIISK